MPSKNVTVKGKKALIDLYKTPKTFNKLIIAKLQVMAELTAQQNLQQSVHRLLPFLSDFFSA